MPPHWATNTQFAQSTLLPPPLLLVLGEFEQPAASSAPLSATAAAAYVFLLRTIPPAG